MGGLSTWVRRMFGEKEQGRLAASPPGLSGQPHGLQSFAEDQNGFALTLYGELLPGSANLFFSPFSIRAALGMTYAGAGGETAAQMSRALHFAPAGEAHVAFGEIIGRLNTAGGDKYEMAVANSLWGQNGAPLQAGFLNMVARHYGAAADLVDFVHRAEAARVMINQWVGNKTRNKIQELIPSGGVNADTRLVLANAVYFKGTWALQFAKHSTLDEPFYLEGGGEALAPLMRQHEAVRYVQADGYQAVDLDYDGGDLSMLVLLPGKRDGIRDLETRLSTHMLNNCVARMRAREVMLLLPRFKMNWGVAELRARLRALGMPLAFDRSQADFSGINGYKPPHEQSLFISAVYHKAFVEVNERGTEAAAATAMAAVTASFSRLRRRPAFPVFRADHPFVFAIRDRTSGAILFLGRVADPTRES